MERNNREDYSIQIDRAISNLEKAQALAWSNDVFDRHVDMAYNVLHYTNEMIGEIDGNE